MKVAVIIFHKNIERYPLKWVIQCYYTIIKQSYQDFNVFELDYEGTNNQTYPYSSFDSIEMDTYADAQNYLLDKVFNLNYDCAFNINIDDWYNFKRFEIQIPWINKGYDIISSNFKRVNSDGKIIKSFEIDKMDIGEQIVKGNNIIANPVVCYSRNFWLNCDRLNPSKVPNEDFNLWKKSYNKFRFIILPEFLLYHRVHSLNESRL